MKYVYMFNRAERNVVVKWLLSLHMQKYLPDGAFRAVVWNFIHRRRFRYAIAVDAYLDLRVLYHNSIYEQIERKSCNLDITVKYEE